MTEGELTLGGEHTTQYIYIYMYMMYYRTVHLKPMSFY